MPGVAVIIFLLYWMAVFAITFPGSKAKQVIGNIAPKFNSLFGYSWRLFTPPYTFNVRLYFIVRNIHLPYKTDTVEVLQQIALQKQTAAPFNQQENITDYLVNSNVNGLIKTVWGNKNMPAEIPAPLNDSGYVAQAIAKVETDQTYQMYLATLKNYCQVVLKQHRISSVGKEIKIMIKEKAIRPFDAMQEKTFTEKERLVFETAFYKPTL